MRARCSARQLGLFLHMWHTAYFMLHLSCQWHYARSVMECNGLYGVVSKWHFACRTRPRHHYGIPHLANRS
ncbi:hypothetical protein GGR53DRAFT_487304 [Hypoxylon sp. FL1150]|nr:hypothetical protein GGR53DRAFT_487304 [Hypoxylon sp. FL1150]